MTLCCDCLGSGSETRWICGCQDQRRLIALKDRGGGARTQSLDQARTNVMRSLISLGSWSGPTPTYKSKQPLFDLVHRHAARDDVCRVKQASHDTPARHIERADSKYSTLRMKNSRPCLSTHQQTKSGPTDAKWEAPNIRLLSDGPTPFWHNSVSPGICRVTQGKLNYNVQSSEGV